MDPWSELESMAGLALRAADHSEEEYQPTPDEIKRWQNLFNYTKSEAVEQIRQQKKNSADVLLGQGCRISDLYWEEIRAEKEAQGHDRDSYEHYCSSMSTRPEGTTTTTKPKTTFPTKNTYYLIKLDGPLSSAETIRVAGGLPTLPPTFSGTSNLEDGEDSDRVDNEQASFFRVDNATKDKILEWLATTTTTTTVSTGGGWRPTIVKDSAASKDLSQTTPYPTLGLDTTLPQNRINGDSRDQALLQPGQDEYPVWYFFYGTLADPTVLRRLFDITSDDDPDAIVYHPAKLHRSGDIRLATWGNGKYNALVDFTADLSRKDGKNTPLAGKAYLVMDRAQEDALRYYETDQYEVVRCLIELEDGKELVRGLTFRFIGAVDS
ncbi:hypothetical protein V8F06_003224 [Rhypophila decipiens]